MSIQFGIFDHIEIDAGERAEDLYEERIAFLNRAEEGGFYAFHLAEHHGHPLSSCPAAPVFLAALARETTRLKLIPTVVCLPLHHPVRIFEELAMVDLLSHGRLEVGVGKGITPFEHLQFGHSPEEATERTEDILAMLIRAWDTGIMSSEGSKFYDFTALKLPFELLQKPHPPLWTAGNVEAAGSRGHNFIFPTTMPEQVRFRYDELRAQSREQPGHHNPHVETPWIAQSQAVVVAETDDEAEKIAHRAWAAYMQRMIRARGNVPPHLQDPNNPPELDTPFAKQMLSGDPIEKEVLIAGSVARVRDYYVEQAQRGVANYFILMVPFGDMSNDELDFTLDAFVSEVIPAVRAVESAAA